MVINPPLPTLALGAKKLGWFSTLYMFAANWSFTRSVKAKFFLTVKSVLKYFGPRNALRRTLPKSAVGLANCESCRHCVGLLTLPGELQLGIGPPRKSARNGMSLFVFATLPCDVTTVYGNAV